MKKLFGWLFHPLLLALLGLAAVALVVWFGGPLLAVANVRPLESETARAIVIGVIVALWLARAVWKLIKPKLQNTRLLDGLAKSAAPQPKPAAPGQAEVEVLDQRFKEAIALLKQVRLSAAGKRPGLRDLLALSGRQYLYQLPWYVFIGAPGSGKTTALVNSGLSFPLAEKFGTASIRGVGGTRNCDWWFTDEAVLLDTAGRYTTQESDQAADAGAWLGFLQLLKKARPRRPINGVLLTLSAADLLQQSAAESEAHAAAIRARLQELHEQFQTRFPIYVLVTKADLVAGFDDFFGPLGKDERAQVWGMTFPRGDDAAPPPLAGFGAEFDALHARLIDRVLERMQAERDPARRAAIHAFPQQFANLKPLLDGLLGRVFAASKFEQAPLLRGVYFTSGTQEGSPIDRVMGGLARALGLERKLAPPGAGSGRSYFLTRLLREVVFAEQGLAGSNLRWERRRTLLQWGGYALALLLLAGAGSLWTLSYLRNKAYVEQVAARLAQVQREVEALPPATGQTDVAALLPLLRSVQALAHGDMAGASVPWSMGFGMYQGRKLDAAAEQAYRRLLDDAFLPRIASRIEEQLRGANAANLEFAYEALKSYLMLHDSEHFDADALRAWIGFDWDRSLPRNLSVEQRAELDRHLEALLERGAVASPRPADQNLINSTRSMLARYPFANRVYSRLKREGVGAGITEFTITKAAGPAAPLVFTRTSGAPLTQGVPGLFTYDGYHKAFVKAAERVTKQLAAEEPWVMGRQAAGGPAPDAARLSDDVRRIYLSDYAKVWEDFLGDIRLVRSADLAQSIQLARLLSAPDNPLVPFLRAASRETTLGRKQEAEKSIADKAAERLQGTKAELGKLFGAPAAAAAAPPAQLESIVDDRFEALRRLVTAPAPGQPAPIDGVVALLNDIYTMLSATETALKGKVAPPPSDVPAKVKADAARMPEPLRGMVQALAAAGTAQAVGASRQSLSSEVGSTIGEFCKQAINGRYPFVRSSARDVLPDDFARLFAPGGLIDAFFQKNLADKVDTSTRPWTFKRVNEVSFGSSATLMQFQRAQVIRDVFFRGGGNAAALRLEFKPTEMDAGVTQFILDVDGQLVRYSHGPVVPQTVQWPGPRGSTQVRLQMQPPGPNGVSGVTTEGPWALFRLFDKVQVEPTSAPERFKAVFSVDGRKATFDVIASSVRNPFRLNELEQFQCPSGL